MGSPHLRTALVGSLLAWLASREAAALCPASADTIRAEIQEAENAFSAIDTVHFKSAMTSLRADLGCLAELPDPTLAAAVHEVEALDAFFDQDQGRALLSLRAMVEVRPDAELSEDLAPSGGELRAWFTMARHLPTTRRGALELPPGLRLWVDGQESKDLPTDRPALVALLGSDGSLIFSGIVTGPGALPLPALPPPSAPAARPPRRLLLAAGGLAAVSAGLWVGALVEERQVREVGEAIAAGRAEVGVADAQAFDALVGRANALGVAGQVTAGLALGLGGVGLVVRW